MRQHSMIEFEMHDRALELLPVLPGHKDLIVSAYM